MKKVRVERRVQAVVFELIKLGQSGFLNRVECRLTQTFYKEADFSSNVGSRQWVLFWVFPLEMACRGTGRISDARTILKSEYCATGTCVHSNLYLCAEIFCSKF